MRFTTLLLMTMFIGSCQDNDIAGISDDLVWTIDTQYLRQGCYTGQDCIPSLENPSRSTADGENISFLDDDELVVGVWNGSEHIAYPHSILDWHEIVNETGYTISYCPLTGSAIHLESSSEFGVSGMLFNSNLIMYDRDTESFWPQMLLKSAAGDRSGGELHLNNMVETTWGNWKSLFPATKVINSKTGFSRNYRGYPYGSYKTCNSIACSDYIYFPIASEDEQLPAKERVLTLINGDIVKAFKIDDYEAPQVISVELGDKAFQVVISGPDNIAVAFETVRSISIKSWNVANGDLVLEQTATENQWDITGQKIGVSSPADRLKAANGYIAYWFSVAAFFPHVELITG